jgi:feruloyl esterase
MGGSCRCSLCDVWLWGVEFGGCADINKTAGNGGFAGSVSWSAIIDAMWYGFAATSTDTGHESGSAEWAYHNEEAITNWGYCALHDTVIRAKTVIQGYYGKNISYSYYRGCSAGGKQGLKEVEMYPNDFDGVIAGAPAWWTTHLQLWNMIVGIWNSPADAPHHIPTPLFDVIHAEVLKQCDPQDGVKDGIVSDPPRCNFRPETLLCGAGADKSSCLTPAQLVTVKKLHSSWTEANSTFIFPSFSLG